MATVVAPPPSGPTAAPPLLPAQPPKKRGCLSVFLVILGILVILYIVGSNIGPSGSPSPSPTPSDLSSRVGVRESAPEVSSISWSEVDAIYNLKSNHTELQKDEEWNRFKGKRVVWSGVVSAVSDGWTGLTLQVKMNPHTFTSDLLINLKKEQKPKAAHLHQGDSVRFIGTLKSWGSLLPITLDDGEILE